MQTYASDQVQNNGLVDAFAALSSGNKAVSQRSIQVRVPPQFFMFIKNHSQDREFHGYAF